MHAWSADSMNPLRSLRAPGWSTGRVGPRTHLRSRGEAGLSKERRGDASSGTASPTPASVWGGNHQPQVSMA